VRPTFTPEKQELFFEVMIETFNMAHAARLVGMSITTIFRWRRDNADFQQRWAEMLEDGHAMAEVAALRLALHGETTVTECEETEDGRTVRRTRRDTVLALIRLMDAHRARLAAAAARATALASEAAAEELAPAQRDAVFDRLRELIELAEARAGRAAQHPGGSPNPMVGAHDGR
jgi:HPt (histidine-containing phosphotransfer) domain-containing protein